MLRSATSGRTDAEVPVVPWQGNVVLLSDDDSNDALVLTPVSPPETSPFKCYEEARINHIATVEFVRQVWLAEQEDIDRFQTVHDEEDAVCAICLEPVRAKASVVTKCQHVFHLDCCKNSEKSTYLRRNTSCWTCPCCREVISWIIIAPLQPMIMPMNYGPPAPPPLAEHLPMPAQHMGMPAQQPIYSPHLASDLASPTAAPAPRPSTPRAATFLSRLGSPAPLVGDHSLPVTDQALQDPHSQVGRISSELVYQNEPEALAAAGMAYEARDAYAGITAAAGAAPAADNVAPDAAEANLALTRWAWRNESASGDGNVVDAGPNGAVVMNIDTPAHNPHPLLIPATLFAAEFSRREGGVASFAGAAGAAGGADEALHDIAHRVIQKLNSSREYVIGSRNMQTDAATPLRFGIWPSADVC
jgi:hypothetical protein